MSTKTYRYGRVSRLINLPFALLGRLGLGADFRYLLAVRGRRSGKAYSTPVDAIEYEGRRWLVAAYGVTNWVQNVRAAREVELRRGARTQRFEAREVAPEAAVPVLRRYLELVPVTRPYIGANPSSGADELAEAIRAHPVFELVPFK